MQDAKKSPESSTYPQLSNPPGSTRTRATHHNDLNVVTDIDLIANTTLSSASPASSASSSSANMATMVAHSHAPPLTAASAGISKRYRPTPAKTFQCRGYGDCRMVFSRSEHLARHIRKHTGERPFSCHCGKQFSRLDNLRQHAQTVHADKQDQNERMMRDLTSLHATMAAANKVGQTRGKRSNPSSATSNSSNGSGHGSTMNLVKQEDDSHSGMPMHQRPGTTSGYEGDHNGIIYQGTTWHVQTSDIDRPSSRPTNSHSFRDPGQSFLAPPASSQPGQTQSFLPFTSPLHFSLSDATRERPGSSASRPLTTGGPDAHTRSLPPLSSVVSASLPAAPPPSFTQSNAAAHHVLPFPGSLAFRRPSTATRPGTAPASYLAGKPAYIGGPGLAARADQSFLVYGRDQLAAAATTAPPASFSGFDDPSSPSAGYESPFSFHPPSLGEPQSVAASGAFPATASTIPRKRPFPGAEYGDEPGIGGGGEYEYGSESRPQSRRLSVMELCNDADANGGHGAFLSLSGGLSRPTTSSGLSHSASALALVDHSPSPSPPLLAAAAPAGTAAAAASPASTGASTPTPGGGGQEELRRGGVFEPSRRGVPSPTAASPVLSNRGFAAPGALFDASAARSPPSAFAASARSSVGVLSKSPSPAAAAAADSLSRRSSGATDAQHDQVRIATVASSHSPAPLGMRV